MGIDSFLTNGHGDDSKAKVFPNGELSVIGKGVPTFGEKQVVVPFRQFFTIDGLRNGDSDMRVDGSSTPQEFFIPSPTENDRYITNVSFVISDSNATLNQFGTLSALTNGCDFEYQTLSENITIADGLVSNFEFIRLCLGNPAFGTGTAAFRANNVSGNSEGFIPFIDFSKLVPPFGLLLKAGTSERLVIRVNDNVSGVDAFNAIAYGFERLPD